MPLLSFILFSFLCSLFSLFLPCPLFLALSKQTGIIGPQLYTKSPYLEGRRANVVAIVVAVASSFLNIAYMVWENHKRRRYLAANPQLREEDFSFRDLTDKQNPFCFNAL